MRAGLTWPVRAVTTAQTIEGDCWMLPDGYSDVPAGKLAAVVTCLEMSAPMERHVEIDQPGIVLAPVEKADPAWYGDLYRRIGAQWRIMPIDTVSRAVARVPISISSPSWSSS